MLYGPIRCSGRGASKAWLTRAHGGTSHSARVVLRRRPMRSPCTSLKGILILEAAAHERGLSVASFTATMIHIAAAERLLGAIMDDERD
jgi:hypothetical protein